MKLFIFRSVFFLIEFFISFNFLAQSYPPPALQIGSTAIYKDSSIFVNWAVSAKVNRGLQDVSNFSLGYASTGDSSMIFGPPQTNGVISLGDAGTAICSFPFLIANGPGFDFAVFENSFDGFFLELAFVEVSSDGINFYRFPSHSLSDTTNQTSSFGYTDATKINNLAGKYRCDFGTPFDLQELSSVNGLNINAITHIKIQDVIGSLNKQYATYDSYSNKINDPWPTPFPSSGFDLDAIGVIHENKTTSLKKQLLKDEFWVYPNPIQKGNLFHVNYNISDKIIKLIDLYGRVILVTSDNEIDTTNIEQGIYLLKLESKEGFKVIKINII